MDNNATFFKLELLFSIILGFSEFKNLKNLNKREWLLLLVIGFIGGSIPFVLFFNGLKLVNGAVGSFIHKLMFLFVALLAVFFLKEKLSWKILIPAGMLVVGNLLLLKLSAFEFGAGGLMILGATVFWSIENVISKKVLQTIEPKVVAFGRLFFGSIFILIFMLFTSKIDFALSINRAQLGWIIMGSVFLLLYVVTWYTGLKDINVTTATSILLLGSPVTTVLSFVFLGGAVSRAEVIGILTVVTGVISMIILIKENYSSTISIA